MKTNSLSSTSTIGAARRAWASLGCAALIALIALAAPPAQAQAVTYGAPIDIDTAKRVAAAAVAEARKANLLMAVAITDAAGDLVYFEKMDGTQTGSVRVAQGKARSAAMFKRPTKVFQEIVAGGGDGLRILGLEGAVPVEGGIPIVVGGRIVGAIGTSGGSSAQDGQVAQAGIAALK